jgi:2,3-bisphosphoglycerate-independent phosphoglycerate mutase
VLDGFGIGRDPAVDAVATARMPRWRGLLEAWPHARLEASGTAVGLPEGQMGNSEVGHLNLGAGRPVLQDLPRIDAAIADGSFARNAVLQEAVRRAAQPGRRLHLISLIGPGGVHAEDGQLVAVAAMAHLAGAADVAVHALTDGRDTPPRSGVAFMADLEARLRAAHPRSRVATVGGRYYGMDRDKRWERTALAWEAIVHGQGPQASAVRSQRLSRSMP